MPDYDALWRGAGKRGRQMKYVKTIGTGALLFLGGAVFTADQLLKASIERQADETFPRDVEGTNGALRYEKYHNEGFMFGTFREEPELVKFFPALCTALMAGRLSELCGRKERHAEKIGLMLLISGALSNLYDRFARGYVVDYLSIKKGFLKKIVLNLGDIAIFAGSALVGVSAAVRYVRSLFKA